MDRGMRIAIVGGSLVGPLTYLLLKREGFENVTVFEAMKTAQSRSGGVMGLRYPTIAALESVGIDRRDLVALRDNNTYAYDIAKGGVPVSRSTSDFPGVVTSWDALHDKLAELVPDIKYGKRVTEMVPTGDGAKLYFGDGDAGTFDLVLFADGRTSSGRQFLDPGRQLDYQGYVVWRGLAQPPVPTPTGFNRYFDVQAKRLFSVTGPILQSGLSYWELSHNLDRDLWKAMAGGAPEERAYLLPNRINTLSREVISKSLRHLPTAFERLVESSREIAGIPVNDVRFPDRAAFQVGKGWAVLLGDALIPVRLQVGAGLNMGLLEAVSLVEGLAGRWPKRGPDSEWSDASLYEIMKGWEEMTLRQMALWVELGRSRVGRLNLGTYQPVRPGWTAVPTSDDPFSEPHWVLA